MEGRLAGVSTHPDHRIAVAIDAAEKVAIVSSRHPPQGMRSRPTNAGTGGRTKVCRERAALLSVRLWRGYNIGYDDFDFDFGQKAHGVLGTAVNFGMALLAAITFDFRHDALQVERTSSSLNGLITAVMSFIGRPLSLCSGRTQPDAPATVSAPRRGRDFALRESRPVPSQARLLKPLKSNPEPRVPADVAGGSEKIDARNFCT